ncbi:MAG: hypothetical protein JNJ85_08845 [Candidatus Kapabacteria bacterium]|nr:hypothetical protein [Candidatus Kapabacteria bacterium]MBX7154154.1 hypothetical protein [Bacteroidota bacterium]
MKRLTLLAVFAVFITLNGCSQLQSIKSALTDLQRLQFKLNNVNGFRLAGIDITNKSSVSDFSMMDGLNALNAYRSNKLPAEFILNLDVKNPNDGSNGSRNVPATLTGLEFRMLIDNQPTITGNIAKEFTIPAGGNATTVPISISLDLYEFFGKQGYEKLADLAFAIGGKNGSASRITLDAKPTVKTSLGAITYPGRINIVDKSFTN